MKKQKDTARRFYSYDPKECRNMDLGTTAFCVDISDFKKQTRHRASLSPHLSNSFCQSFPLLYRSAVGAIKLIGLRINLTSWGYWDELKTSWNIIDLIKIVEKRFSLRNLSCTWLRCFSKSFKRKLQQIRKRRRARKMINIICEVYGKLTSLQIKGPHSEVLKHYTACSEKWQKTRKKQP